MDDNQVKKELLKSTSIIGGTQIFTILLGVFRTKIIALLLGPTGLGILGLLQSIVDIVRSSTSFGINYSAVKYVAEAKETNDKTKVGEIIIILRRWALWTGLLGLVVTAMFCAPFSVFSFGDTSYARSIALVSISLLLSSISGGQLALLQGMRLIKDMAKSTFWGAIVSTLIVVPIYYWLGVSGIASAIVLTAFGGLIISWIYVRKVKVIEPQISLKQTFYSGLKMAKLGFFMVVSGLIGMLTLYLIRIIISDKMGLDGVGYFQAVWNITNIYMGIILNSMLADFFPRLSAVNTDNAAVTKLVNQQLELVLLIGTIIIVGMITFTNLALKILYSSKFDIAVPLLQWQLLGSLAGFITWALGVIFLAKGRGKFCVFTDALWCAVYVSVVYYGWDSLGFEILGIAFVIAAFLKLVVVYLMTKKISNFMFSRVNLLYMMGAIITVSLVFVLQYKFSSVYSSGFSFILFVFVLIYCVSKLNEVLNIKQVLFNKFFHK